MALPTTETLQRMIRERMREYNLGDHSRSDLIIDLRHPDIAIVCTRTYRSPNFQYWVVERCNTTHIEDDNYRHQQRYPETELFGVRANPINDLDRMHDYDPWIHRSDECAILGPNGMCHHSIGSSWKLQYSAVRKDQIESFVSLKNSEEILDKLFKSGLDFEWSWINYVKDSTSSSLKGIFGPERFRTMQRISKFYKNIPYAEKYWILCNLLDYADKVFSKYDSEELDKYIIQSLELDGKTDSCNTEYLLKSLILPELYHYGGQVSYPDLSEKQAITVALSVVGGVLDRNVLNQLSDYWRMRTKIADFYDISKLPLLPHNLNGSYVFNKYRIKEKHDFAQAIYQKHQDEIQALSIQKQQETYEKNVLPLAKKLEWENDNYIIVAPKRLIELSAEGRALSHCVGSYIDSVSNGLEYILFFREKSNPDKPYFTVDVSKEMKVRQIHGKCNCNVPKELMPLFKEWAEKVQVDMSNTNGVYCALR